MTAKKYRKKKDEFIVAVQLNLKTDGFAYKKWGNDQTCRAGDWLVNNNGDCYTVAEESFRNTYAEISPGCFLKTAPVWASQAKEAGSIKTAEGFTAYCDGDYLVANNEDGTDTYAVSRKKFESMYQLVD